MSEVNKKVLKFFSTLADETRLKILISLTKKPKTVNEIHEVVGKNKLSLSAISHQLKQMTDLNIVTYEKKGREKTFDLSDSFCWCILRDSLNHFKGKTVCKKCCKIKDERRQN